MSQSRTCNSISVGPNLKACCIILTTCTLILLWVAQSRQYELCHLKHVGQLALNLITHTLWICMKPTLLRTYTCPCSLSSDSLDTASEVLPARLQVTTPFAHAVGEGLGLAIAGLLRCLSNLGCSLMGFLWGWVIAWEHGIDCSVSHGTATSKCHTCSAVSNQLKRLLEQLKWMQAAKQPRALKILLCTFLKRQSVLQWQRLCLSTRFVYQELMLWAIFHDEWILHKEGSRKSCTLGYHTTKPREHTTTTSSILRWGWRSCKKRQSLNNWKRYCGIIDVKLKEDW